MQAVLCNLSLSCCVRQSVANSFTLPFFAAFCCTLFYFASLIFVRTRPLYRQVSPAGKGTPEQHNRSAEIATLLGAYYGVSLLAST